MRHCSHPFALALLVPTFLTVLHMRCSRIWHCPEKAAMCLVVSKTATGGIIYMALSLSSCSTNDEIINS